MRKCRYAWLDWVRLMVVLLAGLTCWADSSGLLASNKPGPKALAQESLYPGGHGARFELGGCGEL